DEVVELGKRATRVLVQILLERSHLAFPLMAVEPRLEHCSEHSRIGGMKVLIVGSGGREHALAWALTRSGRLSELHAAPGNPGIAALATRHPARAHDPASLVPLAGELRVDLVVVGPEAPLVAGLADQLRHR